jgi:ABC-2 type transport system permease protein
MSKFWIVLFHTYLSKVKTKSFIISTVVMLIIVLGITNLNKIVDVFEKEEQKTIGVLDQSGEFYDMFSAQFQSQESDFTLKKITNEDEGKEMVADEQLKGYLVIEKDEKGMPAGVYKSNSISDSMTSNMLSSTLTQMKSMLVTQKLNLTREQIASLYEPASFENKALEASAKTEEELNQARGLVYILLFVIYFGVIMYANMIAMEVATEKTSRVMEILISSIPPIQQMFAKILGIALLSLTQMALFLGVGYTSIKNNLADMEGGFFSFFGFGETSLSTILYAILFSLLGYFLFATLAAFLGSMVSRIEDLQPTITPMTMLVVLGFMLAMFGLSNPEAAFVKVTSFIPFFTPMLMFLRIGMLEVPFWEIAISIVLLLVTIGVLAVFGARVYRGGVLMYDNANSIKSIKRALQLSKKG